jgi:hypothetical protein
MPRRKDDPVLKNISKALDIIKKIIFYPVFLTIIIIFIFNQILGLILAGIFFFTYFLSYLITLSSKRKVLTLMLEYLLVSDTEISEKLNRPIEDIRRVLSSLSRNQKKKKWLLVFLNKRYIFLNENGVEIFKQVHKQGYSEKKILETLKPKMNIRSRAEVKAIETTLADYDRLDN